MKQTRLLPTGNCHSSSQEGHTDNEESVGAKKVGGGAPITGFVSKLTKQYPRGCPSRAPDLWKRKSNCFTVPNFCKSLRRWYLWRKNRELNWPLSLKWEIKAGDSLPRDIISPCPLPSSKLPC